MAIGRRYLCILFCLGAGFGCASGTSDKPMHADHLAGTWHVVAPGETSGAIAREAGIPLEDFLEINGLRRGESLAPGRPVFLLGTGAAQANAAQQVASPNSSEGQSSAPLRWPVAQPRLTSRFGTRWGKPHEGIDMAAPIGTPVFAAAAGSVIYAGDEVRGYGNMVVVKHVDDLSTVYAHNSVLLVRTGDSVEAGQEIARVGDTGRATAPHLHFEVRRRDTPQDPLQFLPSLK